MKTLHTLFLLLFAGLFANAQDPNAFIMTYEVQGEYLNIDVPANNYFGTTNYTVDFGDGTILTNQLNECYHTYTAPGIYTVTISGNIGWINFSGSIYPEGLKTIEQWGAMQWKTMEQSFEGCINLDINALDSPDLSEVTSLYQMFMHASQLNASLQNWDVSTITNMEYMFYGASTFNQPLASWDVSNVTSMKYMFFTATEFNQPLNNWNVSNVTNMQGLFTATAFNQPLNDWDVSNVTNMQELFSSSAFNQPLTNWDVSNVTNMQRTFYNGYYNQPLNNWNVSNVTNMEEMFGGAYVFNQPLNNWDVSNVTNMKGLFDTAISFDQPLIEWNVSNVTNMANMFKDTSYNQPLESWDVSNVTNMEYMFMGTQFFNQSLENWDVSNVTNMQYMFQNAQEFNQSLDNWDVSNVTSMVSMFTSAIYNQPLNNWNVSNVVNMRYMFSGNSVFNQPLDNWDTSSVTDMGNMFNSALAFNQPINTWNVHNVTDAENLFRAAVVFNQPLDTWDVSNITDMKGMFRGTPAFNQDISMWVFNPSVNLGSLTSTNAFMSNCGIDIDNYDALLLRFSQLELEDKWLNASGVEYCDTSVRQYLINQLGWSINGDVLAAQCAGNNITGKIRFDENVNGCDNSDLTINNPLMITATGGTYPYATFPSSTGEYNIAVLDNTYNVTLLNLPPYFTATPATSTVSFTGFGNTETLNFCLTANETINDLNIVILPITEARPGFEASYQLVATNIGTQTVSNAALNLSFDTAAQTFVSATETANTETAGQLGFTIASLQPFETKVIGIVMQTFAPPTVNGNDILNFTATVTPDANDYTPNDNTFDFAQTVVNSFDPNDKQVVQGGEINITEAEEYLDYIIRFQNTGTASAIKVRIEDELNSMLDWTTLTPISASHNYRVEITDGSHVEYIFDDINLPAQQDDDAGSNGYIAYKIKPIQDVTVGDIITGNAASIYFDYNLPIITNAVATEVISTTGTENFTKSSVKIYPNPVNDVLSIDSNENITGITIYSLQGNKLLSFSNNTGSISLKSLNAGIYLLVVDTGKDKITHKVIKN